MPTKTHATQTKISARGAFCLPSLAEFHATACMCDLLQTMGILTHIFTPHRTVSIDVNHLFSLVDERWLTGEVIDATLDMFFMGAPRHADLDWENEFSESSADLDTQPHMHEFE